MDSKLLIHITLTIFSSEYDIPNEPANGPTQVSDELGPAGPGGVARGVGKAR